MAEPGAACAPSGPTIELLHDDDDGDDGDKYGGGGGNGEEDEGDDEVEKVNRCTDLMLIA